jgi:hypothetical protein
MTADQLQNQKNARVAMLRYQASKSIDAQGDKMTMPGLALGGLTGAAIGSVRDYYGRSRVLPLAAVGGAVGMLGLRMAGRMDERNRLNNLAKDMKKTNLQANYGGQFALRELSGSPMDRYNRSMNRREDEFMQKLREASLRDHMDRENIHNRLYNSTYAAPGMILGGAAGVGAGTFAGIKGLRGPKLAVPLALAGGVIGGTAGFQIGGRIRKNKDMKKTNLQALKPALRELAARSEQLKEFAMVRDASGRYVEVEENGFPVGAAVKAGAGAAALGGAGYGAYKGHQAIMDKFGTFGPMGEGKNRYVEAYKGAGAAGFGAVKAGGQAGWDSLKNAGQGAMNSSQAAVQSGVNSAKSAAQSGLNTAKKSGFGRRLRAGLLGAARWMK